jgi:FtsP/CotA-like multicopper oxidase with cupredoxin domain
MQSHLYAGLVALAVSLLFGCEAATVRMYFIAADEVLWDYAPTGVDGMTGLPFGSPPSLVGATMAGMPMTPPGMGGMGGMGVGVDAGVSAYVVASARTIGRVYKKALFREYTDATFTTLKARPSEWTHLGLLGPLIRAEVGDTINVIFKNHASRPYSMHPHGVFYTRANEGVPNSVGAATGMGSGNAVAPGATYEYTWLVPERAGPGPLDGSSILWMYHSHVDEVADTNAGLIGPLVITKAGASTSGSELRPVDVSREFILSFTIMNENDSPYLNDSIATIKPPVTRDAAWTDLVNDPAFVQSNMKHAINGYLFSNVAGLSTVVNERVRWYVFSLGSEADIHGAHWHGNTLLHVGQRVDAMELIPASLHTLDMVPDDAGTWMIHCHTNMHIKAGMIGFYSVSACSSACPSTPRLFSGTGRRRIIGVVVFLSLLGIAVA